MLLGLVTETLSGFCFLVVSKLEALPQLFSSANLENLSHGLKGEYWVRLIQTRSP